MVGVVVVGVVDEVGHCWRGGVASVVSVVAAAAWVVVVVAVVVAVVVVVVVRGREAVRGAGRGGSFLLRNRQRERAQRGDVRFECIARYLHNLLGESHTPNALIILLLEDRPVTIINLSHVGTHDVQQLEARASDIARAIGEEERGSTAAEEAIGEEHRTVIPAVPILWDGGSGSESGGESGE